MTAKLLMHSVMCAALFAVFAIRVRSTTRPKTMWAFMAGALCMGASPFAYRMMPGFFPRMTIHPAQLFFLSMVVVWFTPKTATEHMSINTGDDQFHSFPAETDRGGLTVH